MKKPSRLFEETTLQSNQLEISLDDYILMTVHKKKWMDSSETFLDKHTSKIW